MNLKMRPMDRSRPSRANDVAVRVVVALALLGSSPGSSPAWAAPVPGDRPATAVPTDRSGSCPAAQAAIASERPGKYAEAGRLFEACARAGDDSGLWKKAGMARYSARQFAHAIQALHAYLQVQPGDPQAELMLQDARKNAGTVRFSVVVAAGGATPERLRVSPRDGAPGDQIELPWSRSAVSSDVWLDPGPWVAELVLPDGSRVGPQDLHAAADTGTPQVVLFRVEAAPVVTPPTPAAAGPVEVELSLGPAAALRRGVGLRWSGAVVVDERVRVANSRRALPPGTWQMALQTPRFEGHTATLELRPGEPQRLRVDLKRTREDKARIGMAAAMGGVGLGMFVGGLALALGARGDYRDAAGQLDAASGEARAGLANDAFAAIRRGSNGTMLLTGGLGAGVAALMVAAGGQKKALAVEAGLGAAVLIAGVAWLIPVKGSYADRTLATGDRAFLDERRSRDLAASGLIGLGAGLAAGASLALITGAVLRRGKPRATTLTPMTAPRAVGLTLQGNF